MLNKKEAEALSNRLEILTCSDPQAADGLFTHVLLGEREQQKSRYMSHIDGCKHCQTAIELFRYQRHQMKLLTNAERQGLSLGNSQPAEPMEESEADAIDQKYLAEAEADKVRRAKMTPEEHAAEMAQSDAEFAEIMARQRH